MTMKILEMKMKTFKAKIIKKDEDFWWSNDLIGKIVTIIEIGDYFYVLDTGEFDEISFHQKEFITKSLISVHGQIHEETFISLDELRLKKLKNIIDG